MSQLTIIQTATDGFARHLRSLLGNKVKVTVSIEGCTMETLGSVCHELNAGLPADEDKLQITYSTPIHVGAAVGELRANIKGEGYEIENLSE